MATTEKVHSFVGKFLSLWANGDDVTLVFNARNGRAKATMEIDLGDRSNGNDNHTLIEQSKVAIASSRQRRIERRKLERKMSAEKACIVPVKVEGSNSEFTDEKAAEDTAEKAVDASKNEIKDSAYEDEKATDDFNNENGVDLIEGFSIENDDDVVAALDKLK